VARGANVMRGYWNNQEETALAFRDGMFRTGDIGYQDAAGYFFYLGPLERHDCYGRRKCLFR